MTAECSKPHGDYNKGHMSLVYTHCQIHWNKLSCAAPAFAILTLNFVRISSLER